MRPVLVERPGFPDYPLSLGGSCFIVTFRGDPWIVTSKHVVEKFHGTTPEHVRIMVETKAQRRLHFFHTWQFLYPVDRDKEDTAWLDILMIRIDRHQVPFTFIDLEREELAPLDHATFDDAIRVAGYPLCLNSEIDFDRKHVQLEMFSVDGAYWGQTSSRFLHAITFAGFGRVHSLNGMSGGVVFHIPHGERRYYFAGVIVTGDAEAKRMHFVDAGAIVKTLMWHYDENDAGLSRRSV
jgi:hypothetical protein